MYIYMYIYIETLSQPLVFKQIINIAEISRVIGCISLLKKVIECIANKETVKKKNIC